MKNIVILAQEYGWTSAEEETPVQWLQQHYDFISREYARTTTDEQAVTLGYESWDEYAAEINSQMRDIFAGLTYAKSSKSLDIRPLI